MDKLVAKNYLTPVRASAARAIAVEVGKSWIVTEEGEIAAGAVTEDEIFDMVKTKDD